jgi:hypothetical protein
MPNKPKDVQEMFDRLTKLEVQMSNVMSFQKWQTGLLAALILMAFKAVVFK